MICIKVKWSYKCVCKSWFKSVSNRNLLSYGSQGSNYVVRCAECKELHLMF